MSPSAEQRKAWIGMLLELAAADPYAKVSTWQDLVRVAMEYGGRAVPRPAGIEFEVFREQYRNLPGQDEVRLGEGPDADNGERLTDAVYEAHRGRMILVTDQSGARIAGIVPAWMVPAGPEPPGWGRGWSRGLLTVGDLRSRLSRAEHDLGLPRAGWDLSTPREELERLLELAEKGAREKREREGNS